MFGNIWENAHEYIIVVVACVFDCGGAVVAAEIPELVSCYGDHCGVYFAGNGLAAADLGRREQTNDCERAFVDVHRLCDLCAP